MEQLEPRSLGAPWPSLTIPFVDSTLTLGTWQQNMLLELDTRGRQRELVMQIVA